ncbi:MAG: TlyA family RNA methyltransferase [Alphaproteobacteria bacterium]|nr:TlyA family RNA methyltransferase [Alphaproteobacteria bacterium]
MPKQRADQLAVEQGLAETRSRAQALIMAGEVFCGERRIEKAGDMLPEDAELSLRGNPCPWVSRGGLKLARALELWPQDLSGKIAVDVGASTGGFTEVLLHHGAAKIYAVDVGQGQLAWKLRQDARVVLLEKTNARHLTEADIPEAPDIVVCDASFISLKTVLPAALSLAKPGAVLIALIKPQFEAGREKVGKGGIVRDVAVHEEVCDAITCWLESTGWDVKGLAESPITGAKGNREFLIFALKS